MSSFGSEFASLFSSPPNEVDRGGTGTAGRVKRKREPEGEEVTDESRKTKNSRQEHCVKREHGQQTGHQSGFTEQRNQKRGPKGVALSNQAPAGRGPHNGKKHGTKGMEKTEQETRKKSKKQKGRKWFNRGQGRQQPDHQTQRSRVNGPMNHVKKQPYLSQEFISHHAIERDGRLYCKFFLSGRCIKEDACKFEHDFIIPDKKLELCKFYVSGFCTKGDACIFMHSEYPCKFFHTGTKCYQGDKCKFSHDPLTEEMRPLLEKVLNKKEEELELQENSAPSTTAPPCLPADNKPLHLGNRLNFYNSCSPLEGPPASPGSGNATCTPAESLFLPLPPLETPIGSSYCPPPVGPPRGCDAEGWSSEDKADCLQRRAAEFFYQVGSRQEDKDTEPKLKDTPPVIPLDLLPGVVLKDPRNPAKQLIEVSLSWPAFAGAADSVCDNQCISAFGSSAQETPMANPGNKTPDIPVLAEGRPLTAGSVNPPSVSAASETPGCNRDVCYQGCAAPAVHNLPVQAVATWRCQPYSTPPQTKTQPKTSTVFRDMFKNPLPMLSFGDTAM